MTSIASFVDRGPQVSVEASVGDVAAQFAAFADVRALVVSDGGRIVGVIHRDAVEQAVREDRGDQSAAELMARDLITMDGAASLRDACMTLATSGGDSLVAVSGEDCLGVATLAGLLDALFAARDSSADEQRIASAVAQEFQRLAQTAQVEFRGQIGGLLAMTDRLARQHLTPDAYAQVLSIRATGEALLRLADDALEMVRARQGRLDIKPRPQLLRELADLVQDRWSTRAAEAGVGLLISYDGDPDLSAQIDPDRMAQVFDNLIENALRYTRQGSVEVGLRARLEGGQVMLEGRVRDTGPGLSGAKLARIFDPDSEGGSLPLSLTRSIILGMKGSIRARATSDKA